MRATNSRGSSRLAVLVGRPNCSYPHPPVFCKKSLQNIENKGRELGKERQERSGVRKRLEGKEIEEVEEVKGFACCDAAGGVPAERELINHALPSPLFSQVLILKGVEVICFDTLSQVLILKGVSGAAVWSVRRVFTSHNRTDCRNCQYIK